MKIYKNPLFLPLVALVIYTSAITPLAYESARRHVIDWAMKQPESSHMIDVGYTAEQRKELTRALNTLPKLGE